MATFTVHLDQIISDPKNSRKTFTGIADLADAIESQGLLQPLLVEKTKKTTSKGDTIYQLVAGERRWRAHKLLVKKGVTKFEQVEVKLFDPSQGNAAEAEVAGLVENISRVDLHPIDSALQIAGMLRQNRWTVARIAKVTGRSKGWVSAHAIIGKFLHPELHRQGRQMQIAWRVFYEAAQMLTPDREPDLERQKKRIFGGPSKSNGGNQRIKLTMTEIRKRGKTLRSSKKFPVIVRRHMPQIIAYLLAEEEKE
jgi:ParB/RepB/Spo0J family partition protein